jgi:hypothetical protein
MPALPSPGQVLKVQVGWSIGGDTSNANVLHYAYSGAAPTSTDCIAIASRLLNTPPNGYLALCPISTVLTSVAVTDLATNTGQQGLTTGSHPGTTPANTIMPASAALLMSFKVNARYRGGHPRAYFPAMGHDSQATTKTWQATNVSTAETALISWLNSLNGFSAGSSQVGQQVAVSYYKGRDAQGKPIVRAVPVVLPIISWKCSANIASQRRRYA